MQINGRKKSQSGKKARKEDVRGYREEAVQVQKKKRRVEAGEKEQWNKSAEALMTEQQGCREEGRAGVQVQKKVESR